MACPRAVAWRGLRAACLGLALAALAVRPLRGASTGGEDYRIGASARAYFESAYLSSGGSLSYTEPVAEQIAAVTGYLGPYGRVFTDMWLCSVLNAQTDGVHRRAFYCYEGTVQYGYVFSPSDGLNVDTYGGLLWDWLGGYAERQDTPFAWIVTQYWRNAYLTPYWSGLGCFHPTQKSRVRLGLQHPLDLVETLTLTPFAEMTWGDSARFRSNFGEAPENEFCGGAFMFSTFGFLTEWRFAENWYFWGRYRQYILVDSQAWDLTVAKKTDRAEPYFPIFGIGIGCRF